MAEINLTQSEADALIELAKIRVDDQEHVFPPRERSQSIGLTSRDKKESFFLDINKSQIKLSQVTFQNRGRQVVVLVRLDLDGPPHRNPDGEEIACPHIHLYREGFGDKWAQLVPASNFPHLDDQWETLKDFMKYCRVVKPPNFHKGLF